MTNSKLSPEEQAKKIADNARELSRAYLRLFGTPDGQRIQEDLNKIFLINQVPADANHDYWSGAKAVMVHILQHQIAGSK